MQDKDRRSRWERILVQFQCQAFVASWTGVVRYHGPRPVARPNHVWVCNHTSMIDYIILTAYSPFAVIMQLHAGWIRFLQTQVLQCLGCLWFNRTEVTCASSIPLSLSPFIPGSYFFYPRLVISGQRLAKSGCIESIHYDWNDACRSRTGLLWPRG